MQIKRYVAPDIRQAMRLVREDQGPDAVILSNRKVNGGVEILATTDYPSEAVTEAPAERATAAPQPVTWTAPQEGKAATINSLAERLAHTYGVDLAAVAAAPKATKPTKTTAGSEFPAASAKPRVKPTEQSTRERAPAQPGPSESARALTELHKEVQLMRRIMDQHLSEMAWQGSAERAPARLDLLRRLCEAGFSKAVALKCAEKLGGVENLTLAWQRCQDLLNRQIPVTDDDLLETGGVIALVGPTGVGKTTTIAKLAARYRLQHGPRHIVLVTTDNYRIAAHEQLKTFGRLIDVPVRVAADAEELQDVLAACYDKRLVLIDTAGMGQRDLRLAEQFRLFSGIRSIRTFLVLSAASQARTLSETIKAFAGFQPVGCILTKLDETATLGTALSTVLERRLPIGYWCDGQQVPEDLHRARVGALLNRCFAADAKDADSAASPRFEFDDWVAHASV